MTAPAAHVRMIPEPSAEDHRRGLPDIAKALDTQIGELYLRPSVDTAAYVAASLEGARRAVLRFREALLR